MAGESPGGVQKLTGIWALRRRLSRHQFDEFRARCVQEGRADPPLREDDLKRFYISLHLRAMSVGNVGYVGRDLAGLEVDDADVRVLHAEAVNGTGNHTAVGKCGRERCFAERTWAEQRSEARIGENAA